MTVKSKMCREQATPNSPVEADHQFPGCPTLATCCFLLRVAAKPPPPFAEERPLNFATPAKRTRRNHLRIENSNGGSELALRVAHQHRSKHDYQSEGSCKSNAEGDPVEELQRFVHGQERNHCKRRYCEEQKENNTIINSKTSTLSTVLRSDSGGTEAGKIKQKLTKIQEDSSDGCSGIQPSVPLLKSGHTGQAFGIQGIKEDSPENVRPLDLAENPAEAEQNEKEVADRSLGPRNQALGVDRAQEVMQQARFRHCREQQGQI